MLFSKSKTYNSPKKFRKDRKGLYFCVNIYHVLKKKKVSAISHSPQLKGIVTRTTGSHCTVTHDDVQHECTFRGKFRIDRAQLSTNPVAVGDEVLYSIPENSELGVIEEVLPRKNYLIRKAILHARKVHILCANIDQAVLIYTLKYPKTSAGFANRFLTIAEAYHIPIVILINKTDLLTTKEEKAHLVDVQSCYEKIGYTVHALSFHDKKNAALLENIFSDKISFLGGHSGAGKSTLVNLLNPDLDLRTQEISGFNDKGMHTTTYTEMYKIGKGYIIDAPGIKEMGLVDFDKQEVGHYFPEIRAKMSDCKFNNCTHINEPNCAIKEALATGEIHRSRYESYVRLYLSQEEAEEY